ncbi:hypothetical protein P7C70_g6373, partial [Phenoliferia sp. Uapishka_3]
MSFKPRQVATKKKPHPQVGTTPPTLAPALPVASTSESFRPPPPGHSSAPTARLVPRAVAKKKQPPKSAASFLPQTTTLQTIAPSNTQLYPPEHAAVKLDPKEAERLELLLCTVEGCISDWGLSTHPTSALFSRLRDSSDGLVHIQQLLVLPPIQALAASQVDLQKALRSRSSSVLTLSESGFHVGRTVRPDFDRLAKVEPESWDPLYLYLTLFQENIPPNPLGAHTTATLPPFLSSLLQTSIHRVILPPLFDPLSLPVNSQAETDPAGQSEAFAQSLKDRGNAGSKTKRTPLPVGGGPYKGFAFVVVGSKEDADRILDEWSWEISEKESRSGESEVERLVREELEAMETDSQTDSQSDSQEGKLDEDVVDAVKLKTIDLKKAAKENGLRSLSYQRWLQLKAEYLAYQTSLTTLREMRATRSSRRSPSPTGRTNNDDFHPKRAAPPHLDARPSSQWSQSDSRAGPPRWEQEKFLDEVPSTSANTPRPRPPKRPRGMEMWREEEEKKSKAPSPPGVELDAEEAVDAKGAFPKGCVLWIRNVWDKSTRTTLRSTFTEVLEDLEEGSGKGLEFVDYEKGLDTCHLRLTSAHLASLIHCHFTSTPLVFTAQTILTPVSALPSSPSASVNTRPIVSTILESTRERIYWENLPEATRRDARKSAAGPAAIAPPAKKRKKSTKNKDGLVVVADAPEVKRKLIQEIIEPHAAAAEDQPTPTPRKKASKF